MKHIHHVIQHWRLHEWNSRLPKIDRHFIIVSVQSYLMSLQKRIDIELEGNVPSSRKQPYALLVCLSSASQCEYDIPQLSGFEVVKMASVVR
jgi:hypothetical protein